MNKIVVTSTISLLRQPMGLTLLVAIDDHTATSRARESVEAQVRPVVSRESRCDRSVTILFGFYNIYQYLKDAKIFGHVDARQYA